MWADAETAGDPAATQGQHVSVMPASLRMCSCAMLIWILTIRISFQVISLNSSLKGNTLRLPVVMSQQPKPVVKETPQQVIVRAYATGLLDGIRFEHRSDKTSQNYPEVMRKYHHGPDSDSRPVIAIQASPPTTKSSWVVTRGHQLTSHTQSSQGENPHSLAV